jgi:Domain of unknown function (DUF1918)
VKAKVGDFLVVKGTTVEQHDQRGVITEVRSADGSPPYVVRWLSSDHIGCARRHGCRTRSRRRAAPAALGIAKRVRPRRSNSGPLNRLLAAMRRPDVRVQSRPTTTISCEERK